MESKIKVCIICHLSTREIHDILPLRLDIGSLLLKIKNHLPLNTNVEDFAIWNVNVIAELEKYSDRIELHIIAPYSYLKPKTYECKIETTYYHFFRNDDENIFTVAYQRFRHITPKYKKNRRSISSFISEIKPDIVHIIGAENPAYATSI